MHILKKILLAVLIMVSINSSAQFLQPFRYDHNSFTKQVNIGVGTARTTAASAYLEVGPTSGSNKGFLLPRLSTTERDAVASPATGLQIYNKTTNQVNFFNGTVWVAIDYNSSLQKTTDVGNTTTNHVLIGSSGTPSSILQIQKNNIQTQSDANGILLANSSPSTGLGVQQLGLPIVWQFSGYKNTVTTGSRQFRYRLDTYPVNFLSAVWRLSFATDSTGGTYSPKFTVKSNGDASLYGDSAGGTYGTLNGIYLDALTTDQIRIGVAGRSVAIGGGLLSASFGSSSTMVGDASGQSLTTGQRNVGIGTSALNALTTASFNTAVGHSAMIVTTTGYSNAAGGANSLLANISGFQNAVWGAGSLENNTTGQENSGVGYDVGLNNTKGIRNVWAGWNAKSGAFGYQNVGVGYSVGTNLTNDSATAANNNVFIGAFSGNSGSQKSTAKFSNAIGAYSYTDCDSCTVVGYSGVNLKTILTGKIGIGTTSPSADLDLVGTLQYTDGNQAVDKVLTSDASGNATWQYPLSMYALKVYESLGSEIKAEPIYGSIGNMGVAAGSLVDGDAKFIAVWLPKATTLIGVKWFQVTQGNYTADNYNGVGLYTYSGGTLTLVASSTDDGNIWKATGSTMASKAFSSTYPAAAGLYFIGVLYNNSAQVTGPTVGNVLSGQGFTLKGDFTNSAKIVGVIASQNSLPSPQVMSGVTESTQTNYFVLY